MRGTYLLESHSQDLGKTDEEVTKIAILPTFTVYAMAHGCPCKFDLKKKNKPVDFFSLKLHKHAILKISFISLKIDLFSDLISILCSGKNTELALPRAWASSCNLCGSQFLICKIRSLD